MIEEDTEGFIEAFTEAVRPHESRSRPLRWMMLVAFSASLAAALGSLLNGAIGAGRGSNSGPGLAAATAPARAAAWTGVAGPGCTGRGADFATSGFTAGAPGDRNSWVRSDSGGYVGEGCTGAYLSMPVSGSASALDPGRYALWTFTLGDALAAKASCTLETYVPNSASAALVGGAPAYYYYYGSVYSAASSAKALGGYGVNQSTNPGRWMVGGERFSVVGGKVSVRMVDAGTRPDPAGIVRDAAAQVRLTCTAP